MYAKRDEAWRRRFLAETYSSYHALVVAALHDAFNAGWEARKVAEYSQIVNHAGIDKARLPVATLFPTEAELNAPPVGSSLEHD